MTKLDHTVKSNTTRTLKNKMMAQFILIALTVNFRYMQNQQ